MELKIAPIENELQEIDKESKGKILSDSKLKRVEELNSKAASLRKNYFKGNLVQTPPPNPAPLPVYKWIFEFKPEPKDVINAIKKGVDQICYRENEVLNKPDFSNNEIRFKYKTSKGKVINAILDKKVQAKLTF